MKRIPALLYSYLLTEMLAPFFAALLVINAVLFLGRLVPLLEEIFSLGIGAADFFRLSIYLTPALLRFSLPMAAMMAVIIAFTRMGNDREIVALKAGGVSLARMLPPVLFFGLLTALATLSVTTFLVPQGTKAMNQLLLHLAKERIEQGIPEKTFSEGLGEVVIYVEEVSPRDRSWQGVYLSDLRNPQAPLTVIARSGSLQADPDQQRAVLTLKDGSLHRVSGAKSQSIYFTDYTLQIPLQPPTMGPGGRNSMSQNELLAATRTLPADHPHRLRLIIEYHQRLVLPVGCFLLTVLGLSLSQAGSAQRIALGVPLGLLAFIAYYVLLSAAKSLSEEAQLPVFLAMWTPNLLFALVTAHLLRRSALELGTPWLDRIIRGWEVVVAQLRPRRGRELP